MIFCPCGASRPFPIRSLPYITNLHFSLSALPQSITINLSKHTQSNNTRLTSPAPVPRTDPPILPSSAPLPPRITAAPSAYPLGSCLLPLAFSACFVACVACYRPSARARASSEALGSGNGNGLGCVGGLTGMGVFGLRGMGVYGNYRLVYWLHVDGKHSKLLDMQCR
jgi:hypothetical protein